MVGMSGGVDSSVTALLLKEQGYHVIGMFLKCWDETNPQGSCHAAQDYEDVVKVCNHLDIPHYSINFVEEYFHNVFTQFLDELKVGYTPNPDIFCNREIKFKAFLHRAMELGADFLATGHYCRTQGTHLFRGTDTDRDQSYFLYTLTPDILQRVRFPIGHLTKPEVRALARERGLTTADKKGSTGICFIGKRNFKEFVSKYLPYQPGAFETLDGTVVGQHDGAAYYTIGQRKGLGIGGEGEAWFVVGKQMARNVVIVVRGADHPALYSTMLSASEVHWVTEPPTPPFACTAQIRHRQPAQECLIERIEATRIWVRFAHAQRAVAARQAIVLYDRELCLGGGLIDAQDPYN